MGQKIALIPARGGSKRIPKKNIRSFHSVPAVGRIIDLVNQTQKFDQVIVSTDSDEIAEIALEFGAKITWRDPKLADDFVGLLEVVKGDLPQIKELTADLEIVACVLPTALLMSPSDLLRAIKTIESGGSDFVVSVGRFRAQIQRALRIAQDDQIQMISPEHYFSRSQDLEVFYHDAAQFYVGRVDAWVNRKRIFEYPATAQIIDDWRVQDIDVEDDWKLAELLWRIQEEDSS